MEAQQISQMDLQKSKAALQKARLSRAYLDAAKSFGVEKDMEFCPCFDMSMIESSSSSTNGYPASMSMRQQNSYIDSESIFKILAAAGSVNNIKNNNSNNTGSGISSSANQAKLSLKEIKQMGITNKHNIATRNKYYN